MRNLDHPNILKVYEVYEDDKCFYFVCEQVQGG
jgi:serine/threonine protein kinase